MTTDQPDPCACDPARACVNCQGSPPTDGVKAELTDADILEAVADPATITIAIGILRGNGHRDMARFVQTLADQRAALEADVRQLTTERDDARRAHELAENDRATAEADRDDARAALREIRDLPEPALSTVAPLLLQARDIARRALGQDTP